MKIKNPFLVCAGLVFCAPIQAEERPSPVVILKRSISAPTVAYQGVITVGTRNGRESRIDEVNVHFKPPNRYRWEYMAPDGSVERVVVSNGTEEKICFPKQGKTLTGRVTRPRPGMPLAQKEWNLLLANYNVNVAGIDTIMGRPAWKLALTPRMAGKCHRLLWVDRETGVILENKKFRPHEDEAVLSRFVRFEAPAVFADTIFIEKNHDRDRAHAFDQRYGTPGSFIPTSLPGGFQLVSADSINLRDHVVTQMRYSDGLSLISVFQTSEPVAIPNDVNTPSAINHVISQPTNNGHITLVGDISDDLLKEISYAFNK